MAATRNNPEYRREMYLKNKEKDLAQNKLYRLAHPAKMMHIQAKRRAKNKGLVFNIDVQDIQDAIDAANGTCPALNIEMQVSNKRMNPNSPSLDRIDSTRGYEKDNICVISTRANILKRDATLDELENLTNWLRDSQGGV